MVLARRDGDKRVILAIRIEYDVPEPAPEIGMDGVHTVKVPLPIDDPLVQRIVDWMTAYNTEQARAKAGEPQQVDMMFAGIKPETGVG